MVHRTSVWLVGLVALTAALVTVAAGAGILLRGDLVTVPFATARGDVVEILRDGIYRFNVEAMAAEGIGWDLVTLLAVVPALVLTLPGLARGAPRAHLLTVGLLAYLLYQYAEYAMALAYGPLFLVYVAIAALSVSLLGVLVSRLDLAVLAAAIDPGRFPRRGAAAFGGFMAVLLAGMWLPLIGRTLTAEAVPELAGGTTLVVQAFDLAFLVPLGILSAVAAWRRMPIGYVLATVVAVKGTAMGAAIAAMLVVEGLVTGVVQFVPILGFAGIAALAGALALRIVGSIPGSAADRTVRPRAVPHPA